DHARRDRADAPGDQPRERAAQRVAGEILEPLGEVMDAEQEHPEPADQLEDRARVHRAGRQCLRIGQGLQQYTIHNTEDCCVGADPDGQGENRRGGEVRAPAQRSQGKTNIARDFFEERERVHPVHLLFTYVILPTLLRAAAWAYGRSWIGPSVSTVWG